MRNFKLTIEYDGTNYFGWQKQKKQNTIQEEIENAIFKITQQKVKLCGSGRTDRGVHAFNQVANFICQTKLSEEKIFEGLNALTKEDITIKECKLVDINFHSQFSSVKKTYLYFILNKKLAPAISRQYFWHIKKELDIKLMNKAAEDIIGTYNFEAFEKSGSPRFHTIRTIMDAKFYRHKDYIVFSITANGFLRQMVRNILGAIVDVGLSRLKIEDFKKLLLSKAKNTILYESAPAKGLFLFKVYY